MEQFLNERSETLVSGLRYGLKEQASLIVDRREATFFPSGPSSGISPTNSRMLKFTLGSDSNWLMSNTLQFTCTVTNTDANNPLRFLGPLPHCLIRTLRLFISGVPVEVVEDANRLHNMFTLCLSKDHMVQECTKGAPMLAPYFSQRENHRPDRLTAQDQSRQLEEIPAASLANGSLKSVEVTGSLLLGTL